jgi:hypothetical protein
MEGIVLRILRFSDREILKISPNPSFSKRGIHRKF